VFLIVSYACGEKIVSWGVVCGSLFWGGNTPRSLAQFAETAYGRVKLQYCGLSLHRIVQSAFAVTLIHW